MIKAVFFDFDFTLADASVGIIQCTNKVLDQMGYEKPTEEQVCRAIGLPLQEMFVKFTGVDDPELKTQFKTLFVKAADGVITLHTRFFEDALEVLHALHHRGILIGIVSTKFRYRIEEVLRRDELMDLFSIVVGGEDVQSHKPDPEGILFALNKLSVKAEEAVFVGDTVLDQGAADAAGVRFKAVLNGTTTREDFEKNGVEAQCIFNNLTELLYSLTT